MTVEDIANRIIIALEKIGLPADDVLEDVFLLAKDVHESINVLNEDPEEAIQETIAMLHLALEGRYNPTGIIH